MNKISKNESIARIETVEPNPREVRLCLKQAKVMSNKFEPIWLCDTNVRGYPKRRYQYDCIGIKMKATDEQKI